MGVVLAALVTKRDPRQEEPCALDVFTVAFMDDARAFVEVGVLAAYPRREPATDLAGLATTASLPPTLAVASQPFLAPHAPRIFTCVCSAPCPSSPSSLVAALAKLSLFLALALVPLALFLFSEAISAFVVGTCWRGPRPGIYTAAPKSDFGKPNLIRIPCRTLRNFHCPWAPKKPGLAWTHGLFHI